jgi:putative transposase
VGSWGYNEIQRPRRKYVLIDYEVLSHLSGFDNFDDFQSSHRNWIEAALSDNQTQRQECWTQSIAAGSRSYVEAVKNQMGGFAIGRKIRENAIGFELREPQPVYNGFLEAKKSDIEAGNLCFWNV